jgi:anhydro-N-acetylmuramic acid kinase
VPLYAGLISGTSMDGVEAVLLEMDGAAIAIRAAHHHDYPADLRRTLERTVAQPDGLTPDELGQLDARIGEVFAAAALALLARSGTPAAAVRAIGSHGQTLLHRPRGPAPFTLQIGDPNIIAERCSVDVVADFRRRDVAAGGEAAPLAPGFHAAVFTRPGEDVAVVNIGGIANVTLLGEDGSVRGFDTGPGNCLMDLWATRTLGQPYDRDGGQASAGRPDEHLLRLLLEEPYLAVPFPKSTGRELFNSAWLDARLGNVQREQADVQATLNEYTAITIAQAITGLAGLAPRALHVCGGGAFNAELMRRLAVRLPGARVADTGAIGIPPDQVEAALFAWLAHRRVENLAGNQPAVTGARGRRVLGAIYSGVTSL